MLVDYKGACHCGRVNFVVSAPAVLEVEECNCSICSKAGFLHLIVPKDQFTLKAGEEELSTYHFNTGIAQHYFCRHCGIKPFYIPRSNPDGIDVNVRCLEPAPSEIRIIPFDGQHWEQNAHKLAHKSKPNIRK